MLVSLGRVSAFLTAKDLEKYVEDVEEEDFVFEFENATLSWHDEKPKTEEMEKDEAKGEEAVLNGNNQILVESSFVFHKAAFLFLTF